MTRRRIDKYINQNYDLLLRVSRGLCMKYGRKYEPEGLIGTAYIHVLQKKVRSQIPEDDEDKLQSYLIANIKQEISKPKSTTNLSLKIYDAPEYHFENVANEDYIDPYERELQVIEAYRQVPDRAKRRILEVYYDMGITTVRAMAAHFRISNRSANELINEMKDDLNELAGNSIPLDE